MLVLQSRFGWLLASESRRNVNVNLFLLTFQCVRFSEFVVSAATTRVDDVIHIFIHASKH